MNSIGILTSSLCLALTLAACGSASGGVAAGAVDTTSDLAVGGSDADGSAGADSSGASDAGGGTDSGVGKDSGAGTDTSVGTDALVDTALDADTATGSDTATNSDTATDSDTAVGTDAGSATDAASSTDALADGSKDGDTAADVPADVGNPPVPSGGCSAEVTCDKTPGGYCLAPGAFGGCGMCMKVEGPGCKSDAECTATPNGICELQTDNCLCEKIPLCYEGCKTDADCDEGLACAANHHCKDKTCATASDCPAQFDCNGGGCERKPCTASSQCPGAYCVKGFCYGKAGKCDLPKP